MKQSWLNLWLQIETQFGDFKKMIEELSKKVQEQAEEFKTSKSSLESKVQDLTDEIQGEKQVMKNLEAKWKAQEDLTQEMTKKYAEEVTGLKNQNEEQKKALIELKNQVQTLVEQNLVYKNTLSNLTSSNLVPRVRFLEMGMGVEPEDYKTKSQP